MRTYQAVIVKEERMNNLLNQCGTTISEYWKFSKEIEKIANEAYKKNDEIITLPFDVELVAKELGFDVEWVDKWQNDRFSIKEWGYLTNKRLRISRKICYKDKRWTIAKAIAMDYLGVQTTMITNPFFIDADFTGLTTADLLAILTLLPISLYKKELDYFYKAGRFEDWLTGNFDGNKFLTYLCNKSQICMFHLSVGYHILTQMLCFERQKRFRDNGCDIQKFQEDEYEDIYY